MTFFFTLARWIETGGTVNNQLLEANFETFNLFRKVGEMVKMSQYAFVMERIYL
jgi:hypothetical protein